MIEAKDLRIGNLVNTTVSIGYNPAGIVKVTSISAYGINVWCDHGAGGWGKFEDLEPIPLSAEWLVRMGFVKDEEQPLMPISEMYSLKLNIRGNGDTLISACAVTDKYPNKREFSNYANVTISDFWASNNMYFVHQIQNAVYALTGHELTIKEIA